MASVALGTKSVGSIVKLKENGVAVDYLVVHQGKPSSIYDSSCDGTWLLRKDIIENRVWDSGNVNKLEESDIQSWLNSTMLGKFDSNIQNAIKQVKIPYRQNGGSGGTDRTGANGLSCKIFLLSGKEVGWDSSDNQYFPNDGAKLSYFLDGTGSSANQKRVATLNGSATLWWLRSPLTGGTGSVWYVSSSGDVDGWGANNSCGVRPALILPSSLLVSDDGSITTNTAPTTPPSITIPSSISGGSTITVSWGASTDAEGNLEGYIVERSTNGGSSWSQIYQGSATSTTNTVVFGTETVMYRVKAYDSYGAESAYTTSETRTVDNNTAPTITCDQASGSNLGTKSAGFSISYSVDDADGDDVSVVESMDGTTKRTFDATLEATNQFQVTGTYFQQLLNGQHTMKMKATDAGGKSVEHTLLFTKSVTALSITLAEAMEADAQITIAALSVSGDIPADANYQVLLTNNANDTEPVWEDATTEVKNGSNYLFENQSAQNGFAFNFKVIASRGSSGIGGYISSIQGGFQ